MLTVDFFFKLLSISWYSQ